VGLKFHLVAATMNFFALLQSSWWLVIAIATCLLPGVAAVAPVVLTQSVTCSSLVWVSVIFGSAGTEAPVVGILTLLPSLC